MQTVDSFMRIAVEGNLLRYAAGVNIFCPNCGNIMDYRKTVVAEIVGGKTGNEEKPIKTYTMCSACWDKSKAVVQEGVAKFLAKHNDYTVKLDVLDGRDSRFAE